MSNLEEIKESVGSLKKSVTAYIKKQYLLLSIIGTMGGGFGTWMYQMQATLNHLKDLPEMYTDIQMLKLKHENELELTENDHKRAQLDSVSYANMKIFLKDLPKLYTKAANMERKFEDVQDKQDDLVDDVYDVERKIKHVENDVTTIENRIKASIEAKF